MIATRPAVLATMVAAPILLAGTAQAKPWPDPVPDVPGVGDPRGVAGPPPDVRIQSRRERLFRGGLAWIEVECTTSTEVGCSGTLRIEGAGGQNLATGEFELQERQAASVAVIVPAKAARKARRKRGLKVTGIATARDSLGRAADDVAAIRLIAR